MTPSVRYGSRSLLRLSQDTEYSSRTHWETNLQSQCRAFDREPGECHRHCAHHRAEGNEEWPVHLRDSLEVHEDRRVPEIERVAVKADLSERLPRESPRLSSDGERDETGTADREAGKTDVL